MTTCPKVLDALEACAEAEQGAAKWLAGARWTVAAGVMDLAFQRLLSL